MLLEEKFPEKMQVTMDEKYSDDKLQENLQENLQEKSQVAMQGKLPEKMLHQCIICNAPKDEGIFICEHLICDTCEAEIVRTDVRDAKYPFFIQQLKQIHWKKEA